MAKIPEQYIEQLRASGLYVTKPYPPGHRAFPDGVAICKPESVPGNSIPEYSSEFGEKLKIDAPHIYFYSVYDKWCVLAQDYIPGLGPGDFLNEWDTAEEAVKDILDFYFGDPARMEAKAKAMAEVIRP